MRVKGAVFAGTLTLNRPDIEVDGATICLAPSVKVTAEIKTGKRRVFDYLLSPIREPASESLRERCEQALRPLFDPASLRFCRPRVSPRAAHRRRRPIRLPAVEPSKQPLDGGGSSTTYLAQCTSILEIAEGAMIELRKGPGTTRLKERSVLCNWLEFLYLSCCPWRYLSPP
jgi:hypothetical protein